MKDYFNQMAQVCRSIIKLRPKTILEIGSSLMDNGTDLKQILRKYNEISTKIDVVVKQKKKSKLLNHYYDDVIASNTLDKITKKYDVVLCVNNFENYDHDKGLYLLDRLMQICTKAVVVVVDKDTQDTIWSIAHFTKYNYEYISEGNTSVFIFKPILELLNYEEDNYKIQKSIPKKMTIAYIIPHTKLTGGMKMLLNQIKGLRKLGHKVYVVLKSNDTKGDIKFDWIDVEFDKSIVIKEDEKYEDYLKDCDIVFCGFMTQLPEVSKLNKPVVYWEQGNEFIFGDIPNTYNKDVLIPLLKRCYQSKAYLLSVSTSIANLIKAKYGRNSKVLTNSIDTKLYHPAKQKEENTILLVGNPVLNFKGFDVAIAALNALWNADVKFKVCWVCQQKPEHLNIQFPIEYVINPSQDMIPHYYRNATLLLFTSWYEGFGMPPLEAMASGTAVVCTDCGGINDYVVNGKNAIVVTPGDTKGLSAGILYLLKDDKTRRIFERNGLITAKKHDDLLITKELEQILWYLYTLNN